MITHKHSFFYSQSYLHIVHSSHSLSPSQPHTSDLSIFFSTITYHPFFLHNQTITTQHNILFCSTSHNITQFSYTLINFLLDPHTHSSNIIYISCQNPTYLCCLYKLMYKYFNFIVFLPPFIKFLLQFMINKPVLKFYLLTRAPCILIRVSMLVNVLLIVLLKYTNIIQSNSKPFIPVIAATSFFVN